MTRVPMMVTREMRARLQALGYTEEQIAELTPQHAWDILNAADSQRRVTVDRVIVTSLKDKHDSSPRQTTVALAKFIDAFAKPRKTACTVATCKHNVCAYKNGRAWSPAIYPPSAPRQKKFVDVVTILVVDLDHVPSDEALRAARAPLAGLQHFVHASHSDRPAGCSVCTCGSEPGALHGQDCPSRVDRCVRVVIFLSRPVTRDEWPRFWAAAMNALGLPADPSCCDASRLYFLPSRPKDAEPYLFEVHDGAPLDVDAILAKAPLEVPSIAENLRVDPAGVVEPGQRHAMLKSLAGAMRFRGSGYDEIETALLAANKARCNPPKSDAEVRAIARWAAEQPMTTLPRDGQGGGGGGDDDEPDFIRDKQGHPYNSQWNIEVAVRKLGARLRYDEFSGDEIVEGLPGFGPRFDDPATINLRLKIDATFHFLPSRELFRDVTSNVARRNRFHPVREYLGSLAWDQEPRIERWLIDYAGAPDTPYVRAVSRIVLVAACRRIRKPGAKYDEMLILESPQGTDKCLKRGTRLLMHDGSLRAVEDVRVGDLLMGPDSKPRRVLETTNGVGSLRKIVPTKGAEWVCNDKHVLTVALHEKDGYHDAPVTDFDEHKWGSRHVPSNKYAMLVRAPEVQFSRREVPIEPYLLGLWLGDGTCTKPEITNPEPEIHAYCETIAPKYGVEFKLKDYSGSRSCPTVVLSGRPQQYHRGNQQPLLAVFKRCLVDDEKRIPRDYLVNAADARLELLAGLLDTDGHLDRCGIFSISTKWAGLRDDILFLARSLGFAAYATTGTRTIKSIGFSGQYHTITISGHLDRIPTKVARKKAVPRRQVKDVLRTGFRVEDDGVGEFFGFELGGDGRFLLEDFTITHNSSGIRALAINDDWFTDDLPLHGDTRRFMESTAGKWIVEAGELKGMGRSDVAALKACLSRQRDEARMAYGHKNMRVARQFVIIGTTNETEGYLRDSTGNRRFWPVRVQRFDLARLRADRDQLWAEAAEAEALGESIRLDPRLYEAATVEQEARLVGDDPLVDVLHRALGDRTGKLRVSDAYLICGIEPGKVNQDQISRFGRAIRELGWERQRRRFDKALQYAYVKGTPEQREVELVVEYDPHMRSVRIEVDKNGQQPATN